MLRYIPYYGLFRGYRVSWLTPDVIAGLTVWAVLIPEGMAYGTIAGLPPIYGLYPVAAALLIYAAMGSSRHLVVSVTSANAALSAGAVGAMATGGSDEFTQLTIALAMLVGVITTIAGLLRLGFIANFISEPVLKGFIIGLALTIIVGQLPKLFGVEGGSGNFFQKGWELIKDLGDTSGITLVIGLVSFGLIIGLRFVAPRLPGSLIAVVLAIVAVSVFDLDQHGVAIVGSIDGGLPPFGLPDGVSRSQYLDLAPAAFGIMLVAFAQGLAAAQTYAAKEHYEIDANREMLATGVMNLGAGLTSGIAVGGSLSTTAVNGGAGARTEVSGLVTAAMTILTLLFLMFLFEDLPEATLGAVVIGAVIDLVDIPRMISLYRMSDSWLRHVYGFAARADFIAATAALMGVLIFDVLPGLAFGVVVSIVLLVYRTSRPRVAVLGRDPDHDRYADVARHPDNEQEPGIVIVRIDGELYFANAQHVGLELRKHAPPGTRALIVDAEAMSYVDVTSLEMLNTVVDDLERQGTQLLFARSLDQVREQLRVTGEADILRRVFPDVDSAVAAARSGESPTPPN